MKVRATRLGYYDFERRRPGDVFELLDPRDFSPRWMARVADSTPEQNTTAQEALAGECLDRSPIGRTRRVAWPVDDSAGDDFDPFT